MLMLVWIKALIEKLREENNSTSLIAYSFSKNDGLGSCGDRDRCSLQVDWAKLR